MSRLGAKPVPVPEGVTVAIQDRRVRVRGPKGEVEGAIPPRVNVRFGQERHQVVVSRKDESKEAMAQHGLARSLIANMVQGVAEPYVRRLEVVGVGYNVRLQGRTLVLQVGFANDISFPVPDSVEVVVEAASNPGRIAVIGCDKQLVGQVAAGIRAIRPPEPYKGKGIKYANEQIRRKAGKAFTSG